MFKKGLLLILLWATLLIYCAAVYWITQDHEEGKKRDCTEIKSRAEREHNGSPKKRRGW
jgi:hypothetical protein